MKNNRIPCDKVLWYNIDKNGCIKGSLINKPAIYVYVLISDEKYSYVGSSINLRKRSNFHKYRVNNWNKSYYNNNGSLLLYNSVLEHGWENFKLGVLEYLDIGDKDANNMKKAILEREQYYINIINPLFNICKIAGSPLGIKHSSFFSENCSKARRGKKNGISGLKMAASQPKLIKPETRLKLSSRSKGIKVEIFDKSHNLINKFPTMTSLAKHLGVSVRTVGRILNTGISYDNYIYKFDIKSQNPIIVVNKDSNTEKYYCSVREIAKDINVTTACISKYINSNKLLKNIYSIKKNN